jgi:hypothetical protein
MNDIVEKAQQAFKDTEFNDLKKAFLDIQQPRSNFALEHFVKGEHVGEPRQYAQIVEELRRAYQYLRTLMLDIEKCQLEQETLKNSGKMTRLIEIEIEKKKIEQEDHEASLIGKLREFTTLYNMWKSFSKKYTAAEIDEAEPEYWKRRITYQMAQDRFANMNGVRVGLVDVMRQMRILPEMQLDMGGLQQLLTAAPEDKP